MRFGSFQLDSVFFRFLAIFSVFGSVSVRHNAGREAVEWTKNQKIWSVKNIHSYQFMDSLNTKPVQSVEVCANLVRVFSHLSSRWLKNVPRTKIQTEFLDKSVWFSIVAKNLAAFFSVHHRAVLVCSCDLDEKCFRCAVENVLLFLSPHNIPSNVSIQCSSFLRVVTDIRDSPSGILRNGTRIGETGRRNERTILSHRPRRNEPSANVTDRKRIL